MDPISYVLLVLAASLAFGLLTCLAVQDACARLSWSVQVYRALDGGKAGLAAAWMAFGDDSHISPVPLPPGLGSKVLPPREWPEAPALRPLEPDDLARTLVHPDRRTYEGQHYLAGGDPPCR